MSEEMVQHQQATWYRCYQSHSDWRRHDRCIGLVAFWNCYCSKGTQHSLCTMFCWPSCCPAKQTQEAFRLQIIQFFTHFEHGEFTGGITCWDTCTFVPPQQRQIKLGVLCFFHRKPNIITCTCILLEVFIIPVASNTIQEFCKSS